MEINSKVKAIRELMKNKGIDYYIVNTSDPHNSEYLADRYKTRQWITGFTGSAGLAIITEDKALLWTDGRYFIQAEKEIEKTEFELMKMGIAGYPTYEEWIEENIEDGMTIGFDGEIFSQLEYEKLSSNLSYKNIKIVSSYDLVGELWEDRPEIPSAKVFVHEIKYAGKTPSEKMDEVRAMMIKAKADYYLINSLDDIAWLYNIRGGDVLYNPVVISYGLVTRDKAYIFVNKDKIDADVEKHLSENGIEIKEYEEVLDFISKFEKNSVVSLEKSKINRLVFSKLPEYVKVIDEVNYTTLLKAEKNKVEIENQKNAYIKDGVALVNFFHWIETNLGKIEITEISASDKLLEFRKEQNLFIEPSFGSISAYKDNAAMMHYAPSKESDRVLENNSLYLIDSGGQYLDGTTDITRTLALGEITDEERHDFTLTFKGHTNLINAKFLSGSTGHYLDILSRIPLWKEGIDYKCGTGHGVGYMLNVHEGPHRIATVYNPVALKVGMVTSIEPGVYKSGKHGIRLENIVVVKEDLNTEFGQFLSFDILSFVPIDLDALDVTMLSYEEIDWLNGYHKLVNEKLSPYLNSEVKLWLQNKTRQIKKED